MIVAIHQPNFAPWLGFFGKMASADVFVYLDDAQYSKNSYTNRVRIRGEKWLTVPVVGRLGQRIDEVRVADGKFANRLRGQLQAAYRKSAVISDFLECLDEGGPEHLVDINLRSIDFIRSRLGIATPTVRSSQLSVSGTSTERLVEIATSLNADVYLSGSGGANYQEESTFAKAGIELRYVDFDHPRYQWGDSEFTPGLSSLDYLAWQEWAAKSGHTAVR